MNKYDLVIFDMDGTLYRFDNSGSDDAILETGFYKEVKQRGTDFISGRLSVPIEEAEEIRKNIFEKYAGALSIGLKKEFGIKREEYFADAWNIDPGKYISPDEELLKMLTRIPCKKSVLTSAPQVWAENVLRYLGVFDLFDGIWFGDSDPRKPKREAYLQVTDSMSIDPSKTLIVDDEPKYLKPAKELGMTTVLVSSIKEPWIDFNIDRVVKVLDIIMEEGENVAATPEDR